MHHSKMSAYLDGTDEITDTSVNENHIRDHIIILTILLGVILPTEN